MPPIYTRQNTPWRKRVLVPFWVIRNLLMLILIAIYAAAIGIGASSSSRKTQKRLLALIAIPIVLCALCLILDITAIVMFAKRRLSPKVFLVFAVIQTLIWFIILILDIVSISRSSGPAYGIIFSIVILLCYVGPLIYGSVIFHRYRRAGGRGAYAPAANAAALDHQPTGYPPAGAAAYSPYAHPAQLAAYEMYSPQQHQPYAQPQYGAGAEYYAQQLGGPTHPGGLAPAGSDPFSDSRAASIADAGTPRAGTTAELDSRPPVGELQGQPYGKVEIGQVR